MYSICACPAPAAPTAHCTEARTLRPQRPNLLHGHEHGSNGSINEIWCHQNPTRDGATMSDAWRLVRATESMPVWAA